MGETMEEVLCIWFHCYYFPLRKFLPTNYFIAINDDNGYEIGEKW